MGGLRLEGPQAAGAAGQAAHQRHREVPAQGRDRARAVPLRAHGRSPGAGSRPAARASAGRGRQPGGKSGSARPPGSRRRRRTRLAWWWKPRQPRPSKWPRPSSCFSSSKSRSIRQRSFAVATSSSSAAVSGRVESQYLVGSLLALGPLGQEPLLGARLAQPEVVVRRPDPHRGEARGQRPGRALAPGDGPPRARGQARGQPLGRERLVPGVAPQPLRRPPPARPRARPAAAPRRAATGRSCPGCRPRRRRPRAVTPSRKSVSLP